jgi:hypothetical protein
MDSTQVYGGLTLVVLGTALMFATGATGGVPLVAASVGAVVLSVGTLLVGTSKSRQV